MILDNGLANIAKREFDSLTHFHTDYGFRRESLLTPIVENLERLDNYSSEGLEGYEGEGFKIFRPNPEEFRRFEKGHPFSGFGGEYIGETKSIFDKYSTSFLCFNGYMKNWFQDSDEWLNSRKTKLKLGINKEIHDEIEELKRGLGRSEYALFNAVSQSLGDNFRAAFLFWGGAYLHQRAIKINETGEFELDESQRGHWDYIDNDFSLEGFEKEEDITRRLKEECRILNPEFLSNGFFVPSYTNVEHYAELLRHAKSTRVIPWTVPTELSPEALANMPKEIEFASYDWVHYDGDFTRDYLSANKIVFEMLRRGGIVSCQNAHTRRYLRDERFKTLYYNKEGDYALFEKV